MANHGVLLLDTWLSCTDYGRFGDDRKKTENRGLATSHYVSQDRCTSCVSRDIYRALGRLVQEFLTRFPVWTYVICAMILGHQEVFGSRAVGIVSRRDRSEEVGHLINLLLLLAQRAPVEDHHTRDRRTRTVLQD